MASASSEQQRQQAILRDRREGGGHAPRTVHPARAWKDHRRTCVRCSNEAPGCEAGTALYAALESNVDSSAPRTAVSDPTAGNRWARLAVLAALGVVFFVVVIAMGGSTPSAIQQAAIGATIAAAGVWALAVMYAWRG